MAQSNLLNIDSAIKLGGLLIALTGHYYLIKSDLRELGTEKKYEVEHLQYQITELKDCCNNKHNSRNIVMNNKEAILSNGIELRDDNN